MPWWPQELPPAHTVRIKITQTLVSVTRRRCRCPSISSVDKDGGVGTQVDIVRHLPTLQVVEVKVVHALGKLFLGTLHLGNDLKDSPAEVQRLLVKGVKVVLRHWPKSVALVKYIKVVLWLWVKNAALVKCIKVVLWLWVKNVALVKYIKVVLWLWVKNAALVKCIKVVLWLWVKNAALVKYIKVVLWLWVKNAALVKYIKVVLLYQGCPMALTKECSLGQVHQGCPVALSKEWSLGQVHQGCPIALSKECSYSQIRQMHHSCSTALSKECSLGQMCQGCPKALIKECSLHQNAPQLSWLWLKSVAWSNVSKLSYCFELRVWHSSKYITVVLWLWLKSVALVKGITVVLQLRLEAALVKCTKAVLWLWLKNVTSLACWRVSTCCVCVWSLTELTWVWIDSLTQFSELTWVQIYSLIELHTHTHAHTLYYKLFLIVPTHTHTLYYEHTHTHTPKQKQKQQTQEAYESQNVTSCEFQVICACRTKRPKTMANVIAAKIDIKMALKEYNSISGTFSFKNWTSHKIK